MQFCATLFTFISTLAPLSQAVIFDNVYQLPYQKKYDYVVAGGGVAGSVVANRLSENSNINVLLLEAGPTYKDVFETSMPFYFWLGIPNHYQWNYTTVPQPGCNGREINYPRGHILGGSSAINGMVYQRGTSDDFDKLAELTGDSGWNWNNILKYYKKMEHMTLPADGHNSTAEFDPTFHGFEGPLEVSLPGFTQPMDQLVLEYLRSNELSVSLDSNDGDEKGFGWQVSTIHNGTRSTAATAYLADEYLKRSNLDVLVNALVTRVSSSSHSKEIDTVEFHQGNNQTNNYVQASREVILSAGSVNTPHILLNSGIGDDDALSELGIPVLHHLPSVGQNMSDTLVAYISWEVDSSGTFDPFLNNLTVREEGIAQWNATHTGRMANGVINLFAMQRMNDSDPTVQRLRQEFGDSTAGPTAADFEILFIDGSVNGAQPGAYFSMLLGALSPLSRGSITLDPSNPLGPPLFNPAYLSSSYDIQVLRQAFAMGIQIASSDSFTSHLQNPINGLQEAIAALTSNDTDPIDNLLRENVQNGAHVVSTSAMSPKNASWGVVDPDLRVKGLTGLRVVDASIYPFIPGGATQLPTYVLAERASDVIKDSW